MDDVQPLPILRMEAVRPEDYRDPLVVASVLQSVWTLQQHLTSLGLGFGEPEWIAAPFDRQRPMWGNLPCDGFPELLLRVEFFWNGQSGEGGEFLALPIVSHQTAFPSTRGTLYKRNIGGYPIYASADF